MSDFLENLSRKRILRLREVCGLVGLSRQSVYRYQATGRFPRSVKIGISAVGWTAESISLWLTEREVDSIQIH